MDVIKHIKKSWKQTTFWQLNTHRWMEHVTPQYLWGKILASPILAPCYILLYAIDLVWNLLSFALRFPLNVLWHKEQKSTSTIEPNIEAKTSPVIVSEPDPYEVDDNDNNQLHRFFQQRRLQNHDAFLSENNQKLLEALPTLLVAKNKKGITPIALASKNVERLNVLQSIIVNQKTQDNLPSIFSLYKLVDTQLPIDMQLKWRQAIMMDALCNHQVNELPIFKATFYDPNEPIGRIKLVTVLFSSLAEQLKAAPWQAHTNSFAIKIAKVMDHFLEEAINVKNDEDENESEEYMNVFIGMIISHTEPNPAWNKDSTVDEAWLTILKNMHNEAMKIQLGIKMLCILTLWRKESSYEAFKRLLASEHFPKEGLTYGVNNPLKTLLNSPTYYPTRLLGRPVQSHPDDQFDRDPLMTLLSNHDRYNNFPVNHYFELVIPYIANPKDRARFAINITNEHWSFYQNITTENPLDHCRRTPHGLEALQGPGLFFDLLAKPKTNKRVYEYLLTLPYYSEQNLLNMKNADGDNPLHVAASHSNTKALKAFVDMHFSEVFWQSKNAQGGNVLHSTIQNGSYYASISRSGILALLLSALPPKVILSLLDETCEDQKPHELFPTKKTGHIYKTTRYPEISQMIDGLQKEANPSFEKIEEVIDFSLKVGSLDLLQSALDSIEPAKVKTFKDALINYLFNKAKEERHPQLPQVSCLITKVKALATNENPHFNEYNKIIKDWWAREKQLIVKSLPKTESLYQQAIANAENPTKLRVENLIYMQPLELKKRIRTLLDEQKNKTPEEQEAFATCVKNNFKMVCKIATILPDQHDMLIELVAILNTFKSTALTQEETFDLIDYATNSKTQEVLFKKDMVPTECAIEHSHFGSSGLWSKVYNKLKQVFKSQAPEISLSKHFDLFVPYLSPNDCRNLSMTCKAFEERLNPATLVQLYKNNRDTKNQPNLAQSKTRH